MSPSINQIPHDLLKRLNAKQAVLYTSAETAGKVLVSTCLDPQDLHVQEGLDVLAQLRQQEGVYAITMTILRLDDEFIRQSTQYLENRFRLMSELGALLQHNRDVYIVYVITHHNPGQKPFGPLMVHIGGDCYREDRNIHDLESILNRTKELAEAMIKKAVMIFPDIPALHGGKKGEWIIVNKYGEKIEGISSEAIVSLGSLAIPKGIGFLNRYKEQQAIQQGIFDRFPRQNYIRPDSASPDVLSGVFWRGGKKDKYLNMCDAWASRGYDLSHVTCIPAELGGTLDESARPTAYGVATTAIELCKRYFNDRPLQELRFLLEAAGNVGRNTVEALIGTYGIPARQITVFDRNDAACKFVAEKFGVNTIALRGEDFYHMRLLRDLENGIGYDVWLNNGEGDNTRTQDIAHLLQAGVKVFCGGANNFLKVAEEQASRQQIFTHGGWAWPDPASSGGGWTLAVMDMFARCQGLQANTPQIQRLILETIITRNAKLVTDVLDSFDGQPNGQDIWNRVDEIIHHRVEKTLHLELSPAEIFHQANVTHWNLV